MAGTADTMRIYYDKDWKPTSHSGASYYRNYWKDGTLRIVRDYFISGQLQMSGAYSGDSFKVHEGKFFYFYENGSPSKTATFVHDNQEGTVKEWFMNGQLQRLAFFKAGKPEGASRSWHQNGRLADSTTFKNGKLNGYEVWYFDNGQKSETGIYKDDSAVAVKLWTAGGAPDPNGKPGEIMASFKTEPGLMEYLNANLRYPEKARSAGKEGKTKVHFFIAPGGRIREVTLIQSSGSNELDAEAIRIVREMPDWNPGRDHNRPVSIEYTLPVTFKLD